MMPKSDTIAAITKLNPTADPDFLAEFTNDELSEYLRRLANVRGASVSAEEVLDRAHPDITPAERAAARASVS
jgi:hypothetical protein